MLDPTDHSLTSSQKWRQNLAQLIHLKRKDFEAQLENVKPAGCFDGGTDQSIDFNSNYPQRPSGTGLGFGLYYHVLLNCAAVILVNYGVYGNPPVTSAAYFNGVSYNDGEYHTWCLFNHTSFIGDGGWTYYPNVQVSYGHSAEWDVSADECWQPTGSSAYFTGVY